MGSSTRPTAARRPRTRQLWPDVAKAVCILVVVLTHVIANYAALGGDVPMLVQRAWQGLSTTLDMGTMALFFLLSGYFSHERVRGPWRALGRPVGRNYWLYLVWSALYVAASALGGRHTSGVDPSGVADLLLLAVRASGQMWYLHALAVCLVVARLVVRLPHRTVLAVALALSVAADLLPGPGLSRQLPAYVVFFLVGALVPDVVTRLASWASTVRTLVVSAAYLLVLALAAALGLTRAAGVSTALNGLGAAALLLVVVCLVPAAPALARALGGLGRRSLPVYVLHWFVLGALVRAAEALPEGGLDLLAQALLPLGVVLVCVGVALVVPAVCARAGLPWLFDLPVRRARA